MSYNRLKPNLHTITVMGAYSSGKTSFALVPAHPQAREFLEIGLHPSSRIDRLFIYNNQYTDRIIFAVKRNQEPYPKDQFIENTIYGLSLIVREIGKTYLDVHHPYKFSVEQYLSVILNVDKDIKEFLSPQIRKKIISKIKRFYELYCQKEDFFIIYHTVKNLFPDIKVESISFLNALEQEVARYLDRQTMAFQHTLWDIYNTINRYLEHIFFQHFDEEHVSTIDKYYYREIFLSQNHITDKIILNNQFYNVFCENIVIYLPIHPRFEQLVHEYPQLQFLLSYQTDNNFMFGITDLGMSENISEQYEQVFYKQTADAIVILETMSTLAEDRYQVYAKFLKSFHKPTAIHIVYNKLDQFVTPTIDTSYEDPLSLSSVAPSIKTKDELEKMIHACRTYQEQWISKLTQDNPELQIFSHVCYLQRNIYFPPELIEPYNVFECYKQIFTKILFNNPSPVKIQCSIPLNQSLIHFGYNELMVESIIEQYMSTTPVYKKVIMPGMLDIANNLGKTPHATAYLSLKKRLKNGDGYTSNFEENVLQDKQAISINYTANLRNLITSQLTQQILTDAFQIIQGNIQADISPEMLKIINRYIQPTLFVKYLLYYTALSKAEENTFSYYQRFQNFLTHSMNYLNISRLDIKAISYAIQFMLTDAVYKAFDFHVIYGEDITK